MTRALLIFSVIGVFILSSCGGTSNPDEDGQTDGEVTADDAHGDTQSDTHPDQTGDEPGDPQQDIHPDPEPDAHPDGLPDTEPDTEPDVAPDVEPDVEPDIEPDGIPCVAQGCTVGLGGRCCPGTEPASECDPTGPDCTSQFCIAEGDGVCDPHENCYDSLLDCSDSPCTLGANEIFTCGLIETHNCTCKEPECKPECWSDVMITGWYDPCDDTLIGEDPDCVGQTAVCQAICSRSEAWHESVSGDMIEYAYCSPYWDCQIIW